MASSPVPEPDPPGFDELSKLYPNLPTKQQEMARLLAALMKHLEKTAEQSVRLFEKLTRQLETESEEIEGALRDLTLLLETLLEPWPAELAGATAAGHGHPGPKPGRARREKPAPMSRLVREEGGWFSATIRFHLAPLPADLLAALAEDGPADGTGLVAAKSRDSLARLPAGASKPRLRQVLLRLREDLLRAGLCREFVQNEGRGALRLLLKAAPPTPAAPAAPPPPSDGPDW